MRIRFVFSVALLLGLTHPAGAQQSRLPYGPLASAIAQYLQPEYASVRGTWALDAAPSCGAAERTLVCTFRTPLPERDVKPLIEALGHAFKIVAVASPLTPLRATRMANYERATDSERTACWKVGVDGRRAKVDTENVKLIAVRELRAAGDTTEVTLSVGQFGKMAYCGVGTQGFLFTFIARAGGGHDVHVRDLAHFSGVLEDPKPIK